MTYQQRKSIVSICSSLLIWGIYCLWVFKINPDQSGTIEGTIKYWGFVMVLMIPVQIVPRIIVQILFSVVNWVVTKEQEPTFSDELDKSIMLKSTRNAFYGFIVTFFCSMALLAIGLPIISMFYMMFFGFALCGLTKELSELVYYHRGV
ncbi:MAG: hypothetical protein KBA53_01715 [Thermoclostridium sp.]|nr:hypothetical protein [Thermoclostridium sp.]